MVMTMTSFEFYFYFGQMGFAAVTAVLVAVFVP